MSTKSNYPQYLIPDSARKDTIDDNNFYHASFYIKEKNIIFYTIVNLNKGAIQEKEAKIGIEIILKGYQAKNAKFYKIKELPKEEKREVLELFENEVLEKLK